jgi:hypothetical protein
MTGYVVKFVLYKRMCGMDDDLDEVANIASTVNARIWLPPRTLTSREKHAWNRKWGHVRQSVVGIGRILSWRRPMYTKEAKQVQLFEDRPNSLPRYGVYIKYKVLQ